jgi:hypothetical protein
MKEKFGQYPESPKHSTPEVVAGLLGKPPPGPEQPQEGGGKSPERQPLPNIWDVLEWKVRIDECYLGLDRYSVPQGFHDLQEAREYYREQREVKRLEEELAEKGTARDKLIFDLFDSITLRLGSGESTYRYLSRDEFQQLRSKVEPFSDEKIAKETREQNEYSRRTGQERGVFDEPVRRGLFASSIIEELMPRPELVDRRLIDSELTP